LDKQALVEGKQQQYVKREVKALQSFRHPFVTEYYGVLMTPRKIFISLEYIPGGELWSFMYGEDAPRGQYGGIDTVMAGLYAGTVLLALEHIHGQGYCYRDLKPENLLIAANGYIKITDFGFAKPVPFKNKQDQLQFRSFTLCGTPDYMAPEIVLTQGHDKSADYWAYGILLYELLCGHTPFEGRNEQRTFEKIVHSTKHLQFPRAFDPHTKSIIRRLLHPNPALRLGALQHGFDDIRNHAYFALQNVDFDRLATQDVTMPYIPPKDQLATPHHRVALAAEHHGHDQVEEEAIPLLDLEAEMAAVVDRDFSEDFFGLDMLDLTTENLTAGR
jgi:protein kinase A